MWSWCPKGASSSLELAQTSRVFSLKKNIMETTKNLCVKRSIELADDEVIMIDKFPISKDFLLAIEELFTMFRPVKAISIIAYNGLNPFINDDDCWDSDNAYIQRVLIGAFEQFDVIKELSYIFEKEQPISVLDKIHT